MSQLVGCIYSIPLQICRIGRSGRVFALRRMAHSLLVQEQNRGALGHSYTTSGDGTSASERAVNPPLLRLARFVERLTDLLLLRPSHGLGDQLVTREHA